jgi:hypothetical protein
MTRVAQSCPGLKLRGLKLRRFILRQLVPIVEYERTWGVPT